MGSPLAPILSDFVMTDLLTATIQTLQFEIPIAFKYVNDCLFAIPKTETSTTLDAFNKYSRYIKFTMEEEIQNKIPYLDILIHRHENQTITTSLYTKPCASQRLIHFNYNHHITQKSNTALGLIHRIYKLDNENNNKQKKTIIQNIINHNGYPKLIH
jgi:hypothetical protein